MVNFLNSTKIVAVMLVFAVPAARAAEGDADRGAAIFDDICADCHTITKGGTNHRGPNLFGVFGKPAGQVPNFVYSDANRGSHAVWNAATLEVYLTEPRTFMPGTNMKFKGLPAPDDRADVIAFLASMK